MTAGNEPIEREVGETKGRYFVIVDGVEAEMTYSRVSDTMMIIDHTEVPDALRGQKVGVRLVQRAVEDYSAVSLCQGADWAASGMAGCGGWVLRVRADGKKALYSLC